MSEIVLVTQNDEPALAFGEYEISADGNTMYVGSAGVGDGSSEVIYKGQSPATIKYGIFSRLPSISSGFAYKSYSNVNIELLSQKVINNKYGTISNTTNKNINININFGVE